MGFHRLAEMMDKQVKYAELVKELRFQKKMLACSIYPYERMYHRYKIRKIKEQIKLLNKGG